MIDVQIVAYGFGDVLLDCIASVSGEDARVVVVDHRGDVDADRVGASVEVLRDPSNPGFGAGQNRALATGSAPWVLLLNPDARMEPGAARAGVAYLQAHADVALVQGIIRNSATGAAERSAGLAIAPIHLLGRASGARRLASLGPVRSFARRRPSLRDHVEREPAEPVEVEALAATAVLARRAALEQVGGFDARYFLYGEDLDLCRRLRLAGWRVVNLPERWAVHQSGGTSSTTWDRELRWWQGTMRFAASSWSRRAWPFAMAAALVAAMRLCVRRPRSAGAVVQVLLVEPWRLRRWPAFAPAPPSPTSWSRRRP